MWIELLLSYDANGLFWHHKKEASPSWTKPLVITHHLHYIIRDSASSEVPVLLFWSFPVSDSYRSVSGLLPFFAEYHMPFL